MLDRAAEPGGNCGAGRIGLICGFVLECNDAELLPCILDCPAPTTCFIVGLELLGKPGPIVTVRILPDDLRRAMSDIPEDSNLT